MKKIYFDEQIVGFCPGSREEATIAGFCRQKGLNEGEFRRDWEKTQRLLKNEA